MSCSYHNLVDILGRSCLGVDGVLEWLVACVPGGQHVQQVAGTSVHTFTQARISSTFTIPYQYDAS